MCGIVGAFAFNEKAKPFLSKVYEANEAIIKRGPDGGDVYTNEYLAFGHRRLSIIDVSCAGNQPMHSSDKRYTIVFNGEIFNYRELKKQYLSNEEQDRLHSGSDTEVLLEVFAKFREKTFIMLHGFFAAAIYDNYTGELFLARDRYGKKPLLYFIDEDKCLFASEMKALFKLDIPKIINWNILPLYLQLNYVPEPHSLINEVKKLRPGHYMVVTANIASEEKTYYELKVKPENYATLNYQVAQGKLESLMDGAVKRRLIADVPLGAFLSGGIDSSVVVALASRHVTKLNTFSIGYKDEPFFDETPYANLVAKKYHTEHTVFSLSNNDFLEHLYDVLDYIDEPFADSSAIPEYILSYHTRKYVTVALSGDGGDEVFGGYNKHAAELRMMKGGWKQSLVAAGHPVWSMLPKSRNGKVTNLFRQLYRFSSASKSSPSQRYWNWATLTDTALSRSLLHQNILQKINESTIASVIEGFTSQIRGNDFNEVLLADMNLVLLSDMLVKVDLMSMANSLEIRSPFLDQDVVDFGFSIPESYKIQGDFKKKIVQDTFRNYLPPELYNRKKQGFEIPLLKWFRNELWTLIDQDLLAKDFIKDQQIFNVEVTEDLKKKLRSNSPGDSHATIWALIVFQNWWNKYIND